MNPSDAALLAGLGETEGVVRSHRQGAMTKPDPANPFFGKSVSDPLHKHYVVRVETARGDVYEYAFVGPPNVHWVAGDRVRIGKRKVENLTSGRSWQTSGDIGLAGSNVAPLTEAERNAVELAKEQHKREVAANRAAEAARLERRMDEIAVEAAGAYSPTTARLARLALIALAGALAAAAVVGLLGASEFPKFAGVVGLLAAALTVTQRGERKPGFGRPAGVGLLVCLLVWALAGTSFVQSVVVALLAALILQRLGTWAWRPREELLQRAARARVAQT